MDLKELVWVSARACVSHKLLLAMHRPFDKNISPSRCRVQLHRPPRLDARKGEKGSVESSRRNLKQRFRSLPAKYRADTPSRIICWLGSTTDNERLHIMIATNHPVKRDDVDLWDVWSQVYKVAMMMAHLVGMTLPLRLFLCSFNIGL